MSSEQELEPSHVVRRLFALLVARLQDRRIH